MIRAIGTATLLALGGAAAAQVSGSGQATTSAAGQMTQTRVGQPPANSAMRQAGAGGSSAMPVGTMSTGTATPTNALTLTSRGNSGVMMQGGNQPANGQRSSAQQSDAVRITSTGVTQRGPQAQTQGAPQR